MLYEVITILTWDRWRASFFYVLQSRITSYNVCYTKLLRYKKLSDCIEFGKINKVSPYPPQMKDQDGADEITKQLLDGGASADDVLQKGLIIGMEKVGIKFRENQVFVPQVLMSAKAMDAAMKYLKPLFAASATARKGIFIIGTVEGDLHDIGKNLVASYNFV